MRISRQELILQIPQSTLVPRVHLPHFHYCSELEPIVVGQLDSVALFSRLALVEVVGLAVLRHVNKLVV